jgi:hypothetical protein
MERAEIPLGGHSGVIERKFSSLNVRWRTDRRGSANDNTAESPLDSRGNDMQDWLKALGGCKDVTNLRSAIYELCTGLGEIVHVDILTMKQPGKRQALCFLRLESAAQEQQLVANPGVSRFGNELLCVVDLPADQTTIAELPEGFLPRSSEPRRCSSGARRVFDREVR